MLAVPVAVPMVGHVETLAFPARSARGRRSGLRTVANGEAARPEYVGKHVEGDRGPPVLGLRRAA